MTVKELSDEFDIHYNNIAGQSNPNIDVYEKSVYLTKAQLEIIKNYYDALSNRKQKGFEGSEKRRRDLNQIVKPYRTSSTVTGLGIDKNSKFFVIPDETFLIVTEKLYNATATCESDQNIEVKPVLHDEYNTDIKNPFRNPSNNKAWRLDISNINDQKVVEIVTPVTGSEYQMRYIKYPKPIILANLNTTYPGETLSIDGEVTASTSELNESIHREIIDRAVELALLDYKPQNLQGKVQLDARNE